MSGPVHQEAPPEPPGQGIGPHFVLDENGMIDFAPPEALDRQGNNVARLRALHPVLRELAGDLIEALSRVGNTAHVSLQRLVTTYAALIDQPLERADFARLHAGGVRLANAAQATARAILEDELPPLGLEAQEALDSLLSLHGTFMLSTIEGIAALTAEERYRRRPDEERSFRAAAREFAAALQKHPEIIHPDAAAIIKDAAAQIGQGGNPERSTVVGLGIVRNAALALLSEGATAARSALPRSSLGLGRIIVGGVNGLLARAEALARDYLKKSRSSGSIFNQDPNSLEQLVFDAAEVIAGPGVVEQVAVRPAFDSEDRPAYHVTLLVNRERVSMGMGKFRGELRLRISDELAARHDEHQLLTEFLNRRDWEKRVHG